MSDFIHRLKFSVASLNLVDESDELSDFGKVGGRVEIISLRDCGRGAQRFDLIVEE